jgi:hypothetical protein
LQPGDNFLSYPYCKIHTRISEGFKLHSSGILDGCIMAIDGLAVRVRQPFTKTLTTEVKNTKSWTCRKGGFAENTLRFEVFQRKCGRKSLNAPY